MKKIILFVLCSVIFSLSFAGDRNSLTADDIQKVQQWRGNYDYFQVPQGMTWYRLGQLFNCNYELLQELNCTQELKALDLIIVPSDVHMFHALNADRQTVSTAIAKGWQIVVDENKDIVKFN